MMQYLIKNLFLMCFLESLNFKSVVFYFISKLINNLSKFKLIKSSKKKGLTTVKPGDGELYF